MNLSAFGLQGWDTIIRNHVNKFPIVFAFNIKKSVHEAYGLSLYERPLEFMQSDPNNRVYPLPIFNYSGTLTIDLRAKRMRNEIKKVLKETQAGKVHIIGYSISGVDARYLVSGLDGSDIVASVCTISSPNRGSRLADELNLGRVKSDMVDPITRILGVDAQSLEELNSENIKSMNRLFKESEEEFGRVCSIGSETDIRQVSKMLLGSYMKMREILDDGADLDNDGVFTSKEMKLRNHLGTYDADHVDMLGASLKKAYKHVYSIAADNAKYCELAYGL